MQPVSGLAGHPQCRHARPVPARRDVRGQRPPVRGAHHPAAGGTSFRPSITRGATSTSVYGPGPPRKTAGVRLVGSYKNGDGHRSHGFLFPGLDRRPSRRPPTYRTIDYPGAKFNYVHSTMGGPRRSATPTDRRATCPSATGPPRSSTDVARSAFPCPNIVYSPGSLSTLGPTASGTNGRHELHRSPAGYSKILGQGVTGRQGLPRRLRLGHRAVHPTGRPFDYPKRAGRPALPPPISEGISSDEAGRLHAERRLVPERSGQCRAGLVGHRPAQPGTARSGPGYG